MTFLLAETTEPRAEHQQLACHLTPIRSVEDEHPWLRPLYAVAFVATVAISALLIGCGGGDPEDADGHAGVQPIDCQATPAACK